RLGGAVLGHALPPGGLLQFLAQVPDRFHELRRLRDGDAARAADGDGLEVLRAHDGADAGAAGGAVLVVHDAGELDQFLAGRPDAGDAGVRDAEFLADAVLGLRDDLAPEVAGVADLNDVVVDPQVDRFRRLAFQQQKIVTGEAQLRSPVAAGVRRGDG